jgi:hypothetical protein
VAARGLYQDCASEDTAETIAQLRPQGPAPIVERTPLIETPSVPIRYIACTQDRAVSPEWGALTAGECFGATVEWFDASHLVAPGRPCRGPGQATREPINPCSASGCASVFSEEATEDASAAIRRASRLRRDQLPTRGGAVARRSSITLTDLMWCSCRCLRARFRSCSIPRTAFRWNAAPAVDPDVTRLQCSGYTGAPTGASFPEERIVSFSSASRPCPCGWPTASLDLDCDRRWPKHAKRPKTAGLTDPAPSGMSGSSER